MRFGQPFENRIFVRFINVTLKGFFHLTAQLVLNFLKRRKGPAVLGKLIVECRQRFLFYAFDGQAELHGLAGDPCIGVTAGIALRNFDNVPVFLAD